MLFIKSLSILSTALDSLGQGVDLSLSLENRNKNETKTSKRRAGIERLPFCVASKSSTSTPPRNYGPAEIWIQQKSKRGGVNIFHGFLFDFYNHFEKPRVFLKYQKRTEFHAQEGSPDPFSFDVNLCSCYILELTVALLYWLR